MASIARVFINEKEVATLWCEPYTCEITKFLQEGQNQIRIEVTNTWHNRVIYDLGQEEAKRKTWILYREKFNPTREDPLIPAGIIGKVLLEVRQ